MRINLRETIPLPPAEVFSIISAFDYVVAQIDPDVISIEKIGDGQIGLGTRWREKLRPFVATFTIDAVFTVFEPPHRLGFDFRSLGLRGEWMLSCQADGGGTDLVIQIHTRTRGIGWALYPFIRWDFPRREKRRLATLKRLIEAGSLTAAEAALSAR